MIELIGHLPLSEFIIAKRFVGLVTPQLHCQAFCAARFDATLLQLNILFMILKADIKKRCAIEIVYKLCMLVGGLTLPTLRTLLFVYKFRYIDIYICITFEQVFQIQSHTYFISTRNTPLA